MLLRKYFTYQPPKVIMNSKEEAQVEDFIDSVLENRETLLTGGADDTMKSVESNTEEDTYTEVIKMLVGTQAMGYLKGLRFGREQPSPDYRDLEMIDNMIDQKEEKLREF